MFPLDAILAEVSSQVTYEPNPHKEPLPLDEDGNSYDPDSLGMRVQIAHMRGEISDEEMRLFWRTVNSCTRLPWWLNPDAYERDWG